MCLTKQVHSLRDDLRRVEKRAASEVGMLWTRVKELEAENLVLRDRTEGKYPGDGLHSFFERVGTLNTQMADFQEDMECAVKFTKESKSTTLRLCASTNAILAYLRACKIEVGADLVKWDTSEHARASGSNMESTNEGSESSSDTCVPSKW